MEHCRTWFCALAVFIVVSCFNGSEAVKKTYIVSMKHHLKPSQYSTHHDWYSTSLASVSGVDTDLLYSYESAYHGFAASLDVQQVESLRKSDGVLGVYEDTVYELHTTRTPNFLGLYNEMGFRGLWVPNAKEHMDVIVGVLDTGVWPESGSYLDDRIEKIPARWKGGCQAAADFDPKKHCNKKLIGARYFAQGYRMASGGGSEPESPRDYNGHGTHTSSTAFGAQVGNASLFGYATGEARGMSTYAHIASYKVCWKTGCFGSDVLAGMDRAIQDGVDVLSMSLGGGSGPYYRDTIAIGAFSAMEKGIIVLCSAGNSGPAKSSVVNVAPWIMTVGAGTIDRDFAAYAILGNGKNITGVSLYSGRGMGKKSVPLVYNKGNSKSNLCLPGSIDASITRGKIVVCDMGVNARVEKGEVVRKAGGVGMILANTAENGEEMMADSHLLPALAVGRKVGDIVRAYVKTAKSPKAVISIVGMVLQVQPSPVVAAFSSRGPNMVTPQILKPDVIGPGVNILAAWSGAVGPTGLEKDSRRTQFNIMSGTSVSCSHISGIAAWMKSLRRYWSPSMIKSALMTSAYTDDRLGSPFRDAADGSLSSPWAHGAGHMEPFNALTPGLVYDIKPADYIAFLCSLDYTVEQLQTIVKRANVSCSRRFSDPGQLNYPSFSVIFSKSRVVRYTRELTNVGLAGEYQVVVEAPPTVNVTIKPSNLVFKKEGEKLRYTVTFVSEKGGLGSAFGSISWNNNVYQVRSPVAFSWT